MPTSRPVLDYSQIRNYAERFQWIDPQSGREETGYNPPKNVNNVQRVPFSITFLTEDGMPYHGRAVCIGVNTATRSRRLQFVDDAYMMMPGYTESQRRDMFKCIHKGEIRQVSDILIVEIDGVRFSAH